MSQLTPPEAAPLSEEELALVAALTSSVADPQPSSPRARSTGEHSKTARPLARNTAHALDSLPGLFRSYRGRDRLTLVRDGVRLPATHSRARLQDGWLMLDPAAVGRLLWQPTTEDGAGLGGVLTLDGPQAGHGRPRAALQAVARSADRGLGVRAGLGYEHANRSLFAGGRIESLPDLRFRSNDGAETGDRLGQQWSVYLRATENTPGLTVGLDWTRRDGGEVRDTSSLQHRRIDHGLAFGRWAGSWGQILVAYLRDDFVSGDQSPQTDRATHRGQARLSGRWALSEHWHLSADVWGQLDDQRFAEVTGDSIRVEPALSTRYENGRFRLRVTGKFLWGRVQAFDRRVEATEPFFQVEAVGPFAGGFGWYAAIERGAHLPQPWHIPSTGGPTAVETSWTAELGPTWTSEFGALRLVAFGHRVRHYWPRAVIALEDRTSGQFDVLGLEAQVKLQPTRGLVVEVVAGWADDQIDDTALAAIRPATAQIRGVASLRYEFAEQRGFVEAHGRWVTDSLSIRDADRTDLTAAAPIRAGVMGGIRLGSLIALSLAIENVFDLNYDDPIIGGDQTGLDARIALTVTP